MGWQDQGRQQHGWFGHGTAAMHTDGAASPDPVPTGLDQRIHALAYGAVASLPARQRREAEAQYHAGLLPRLSEAMTAWLRGSRLDQASFADRFFGRAADDPVIVKLRSAVLGAGLATSHAEMREAAENLADAMLAVGVDRWPRFVADAQARAGDPATVAEIDKSQQPHDPAKDAIRPVYPIETLLGILAAGVAGGAAAAARSAGGAILRQALPEKPANTDPATQPAQETAPLKKPEEQTEPASPTGTSLPADPDELLQQGWKEISHPDAAAAGHRTFENPQTGEIVRFDAGRPGEPGFEGHDHYHRLNPEKTGKRDEYLDENGNPVARGSDASHILPSSE